MRVMVVLTALAVGCTGERVETASPDAATSTDTGGDGGACAKLAGNLVPDGDFSMGLGAFQPESCQVELTTGRCGAAIRLYDLKTPGRATAQYSGVPIAAGAMLRLRAWFKKGKDTPPNAAPSVFVRSYSVGADGGEVYEDYKTVGSLTDEWRLSERVFTLKNAQTGMEVIIDSYLDADGKTHDFLVADISLTPEPM